MEVVSTVLKWIICGNKSYLILYQIPLMPNGISHPIKLHIEVVGC